MSQEQMTPAQYQEYLAGLGKKKGKYGAVQKVVEDTRYDSTAEANYAGYLSLRVRAREIQGFYTQVRFDLRGSREGEVAPITYYLADFVIVNLDDSFTVVDIKGGRATITRMFRLKAKMVLDQFGMEIICIDGKTRQPISYTRKRK